MLLSWRKIRLIRRLASFLSYAVVILVVNTVIAQSSIKQSRVGQHFIETFNPLDYKGYPQTFSIVQGIDNRMYMANVSSVLVYDGEKWERILLPNNKMASCLAVNASGIIFYGSVGDIGYFEPDSTGNLNAVSLIELFPELQKVDFSRVWEAIAIENEVYFRTDKVLFQWKENKLDFFESEDGFQSIEAVGSQLYFKSQKNERQIFYKLENDRFIKLLDTEKFMNGSIMDIKNPDEFLVLSYHNGIYRIKHEEVVPFITNKTVFNTDNTLYQGIVAPDGNIVLAMKLGLFIYSEKGKLLKHYSNDDLKCTRIYTLSFDNQGNLWAGGNVSIAKIKYSIPITYFGKEEGVKGTVNDIIEHDGILYLATDANVLYIDLNNYSSDTKFKKANGLDDFMTNFLEFDDQLLVAAQNGIYQVNKNRVIPINVLSDYKQNTSIIKSKLNPTRIYISSTEGIYSAIKKDNSWEKESTIEVNTPYQMIAETNEGNLWATGWNTTFFDLTHSQNNEAIYVEKSIPFELGGYTLTKNLNNDLLFLSPANEDIMNYNKEIEAFENVNRLIAKNIGVGSSYNISVFSATLSKIRDNRFTFIRVSDNKNIRNDFYKLNDINEPLKDSTKVGLNYLYHLHNEGYYSLSEDRSGLLWFGSTDGVYIYDKSLDKVTDQAEIPTLINSVAYKEDSVIYAGFNSSNYQKYKLPHKGNSVKFNYAMTSYSVAENKHYQYKLDGYDEEWSNFTTNTSKEYTNLDKGSYTFKVRGLDINNNLSKEATYEFTILAPWYAAWWAYIVYALVLVVILFIFDRIRWNKTLSDKKRLEKIVEYRTREVKKQAQKLAQQTEKLRELDKLKSKFFANISHEFRTPITLILGPLEQLLEQKALEVNVSRTHLERMFRNSKRLQFLVNQLLDLVSLDAGNVGLHIVHRKLCHFIRYFANSFTSLAEMKNIEYIIDIPEHDVILPFDTDAIEKIYYNLLANAFKFTPEYGQVSFLIESLNSSKGKIVDVEKEKLAYIKTTVKDTGEGISPTMINQVFDRFAKNDESHNSGVGIGLSLVKELVELYGGELSVDSTLGVGTTFTVILPIDINLIDKNVIKSISEYDNSDATENISITQKIEELLPTRENQNALAIDSDKAQVLVIEDNQDVRAYLVECLQQAYNVETAQNGREGLELIKETVPDLVISDIMMPEVDGITFLKTIKEDEITSHIPVVLLTAKADEKSKLEGYEFGADAYLVKPFSDKELLLRVKKIIEQREKLIEKYTNEIILKPSNIKIKNKDEVFIKRVIVAIEENIDNTTFDVGDLQSLLGVSRMQLHRKLIALTKMSTTEFVKHIRLLRAEQLLKESNLRVSEVGYAVGFSDPSYFSKCFKEHFGVAPSSFAKEDS